MDLRQYLYVPVRRYKEVIVIMLLFLALSMYTTSMKNTKYPVTMFYTVSLDDEQETPDFKYSNFYAQNASLEFTRTVSGWFDDPSFEANVFLKANVNKDEEMTLLKKLFGFFKAKRVERQNIQVTFDTESDEKSHKLADTLTKVLNNRLNEYNKNSNSNYRIALMSKWVEKKEVSYPLAVTIAVLMGLVIGILLVYMYEYFTGRISTRFHAEEIIGKEAIEQDSISSYPSKYLQKFVELHKIDSILSIGIPLKNKFTKVKDILIFPKDVDKIDVNTKMLVVVIIGYSKIEDLKKVSNLIDKQNIELVVLT